MKLAMMVGVTRTFVRLRWSLISCKDMTEVARNDLPLRSIPGSALASAVVAGCVVASGLVLGSDRFSDATAVTIAGNQYPHQGA